MRRRGEQEGLGTIVVTEQTGTAMGPWARRRALLASIKDGTGDRAQRSRRTPAVPMVQAADLRDGKHFALRRRFTQKTRSQRRSRGRLTERRRTSNWCRNARFSAAMAARPRRRPRRKKNARRRIPMTDCPRKCPSVILARASSPAKCRGSYLRSAAPDGQSRAHRRRTSLTGYHHFVPGE